MLGAASKTMGGDEQMHFDIVKLAPDGTPIFNLSNPGVDLRPPGWQAHVFCTNLCLASKGYGLGLDEHASKIAEVLEKVKAGAHGSGRKSHQQTFFDFLLTPTPANWVNTIHHKLQVFTSPQISVPVSQESGVLNEEQFCILCKTCKSLGVRTTMAAIKTWSNAWTTTTRMHEAIELPCIFGCPAEDELDHYLCCDPLWTLVISSSFRREELLSASPLQRIGLDSNSMQWLQMLSVALPCYHAIKTNHRQEIALAIESGHHCQVQCRLFEYARSFSRELINDTT